MAGCCVFVAHGFQRENILLQPWRYIYEIAVRYAEKQQVVVITDAIDNKDIEENWPENLKVVQTRLLSVRYQYKLAAFINSFSPEQVWWSTTPRSVAYLPSWQNLSSPLVSFITCPLYPCNLLLRAWRRGVPWDELRDLVLQRIVPRWLFAKLLSNKKVEQVVVQSEANQRILLATGVAANKLKVIPVGIDKEAFENISAELDEARQEFAFSSDSVVFLFLGSIRPIRGIYELLDAFSIAARTAPKIYLGVLARGADEQTCGKVVSRCIELGIEDRVKVVGGWLTREQVRAYLEICNVVTLPFVVVPSDVPIAVLEALACEKPVIGTDVDGIPELIKGRGITVKPSEKMALADALLSFSGSDSHYKAMAESSRKYMATYPDWDTVGNMALSIKGEVS